MNEIEKRHGISQACEREEGATRKMIAEFLGMRKHPALNSLIENMVSEGELDKAVEVGKNGKPVFWYRISTWSEI